MIRSPAKNIPADIPIKVACDEQVQLTIVVVIEEPGRRRPSFSSNSSCSRHIGECAISVISVQYIPSVVGYIKISESIVVVIADGNTHSIIVPGVTQTGGRCHIGKTSILVLAIEPIPKCRFTSGEIGRGLYRVVQFSAIHEDDIDQSIIVVIKQCNPASHRFDQIFLRGG